MRRVNSMVILKLHTYTNTNRTSAGFDMIRPEVCGHFCSVMHNIVTCSMSPQIMASEKSVKSTNLITRVVFVGVLDCIRLCGCFYSLVPTLCK